MTAQEELAYKVYDQMRSSDGTLKKAVELIDNNTARALKDAQLELLNNTIGWIERNHMQPEDFKDRWYVSAMEIRDHITAERNKLLGEVKEESDE